MTTNKSVEHISLVVLHEPTLDNIHIWVWIPATAAINKLPRLVMMWACLTRCCLIEMGNLFTIVAMNVNHRSNSLRALNGCEPLETGIIRLWICERHSTDLQCWNYIRAGICGIRMPRPMIRMAFCFRGDIDTLSRSSASPHNASTFRPYSHGINDKSVFAWISKHFTIHRLR